MPSPLAISQSEMLALAVFSILEGADDIDDVGEQLKVTVVIVNRVNSTNWIGEFGAGFMNQMFGVNKKNVIQFDARRIYKLGHDDFDSCEEAYGALAKAKGISPDVAKTRIKSFILAVGDTKGYAAAVEAVGNATGFRGDKTLKRNVFKQESPKLDDPKIHEKQPSRIIAVGEMSDWPS